MPITKFICPNANKTNVQTCLAGCPFGIRCMGKPTLKTLANSVADRGLSKYSVTELISGTLEQYLKRTEEYAVNPQDLVFAMHGTAIHALCEKNSSQNILTELRLENDLYTGQIDCYGDVLGDGRNILLDYKVTSSYKAMTALGFRSVNTPTGKIFKTGARKGQPKTRKKWKNDGIRKIYEWALQVNAYRMLLEQNGYLVDDMYIQMYIRDYSLLTASNRNINRPIYLLKINRISDTWLNRFFSAKKEALAKALATGALPAPCTKRETWNGRKCKNYCDVYDICQAYTMPAAS